MTPDRLSRHIEALQSYIDDAAATLDENRIDTEAMHDLRRKTRMIVLSATALEAAARDLPDQWPPAD